MNLPVDFLPIDGSISHTNSLKEKSAETSIYNFSVFVQKKVYILRAACDLLFTGHLEAGKNQL